MLNAFYKIILIVQNTSVQRTVVHYGLTLVPLSLFSKLLRWIVVIIPHLFQPTSENEILS